MLLPLLLLLLQLQILLLLPLPLLLLLLLLLLGNCAAGRLVIFEVHVQPTQSQSELMRATLFFLLSKTTSFCIFGQMPSTFVKVCHETASGAKPIERFFVQVFWLQFVTTHIFTEEHPFCLQSITNENSPPHPPPKPPLLQCASSTEEHHLWLQFVTTHIYTEEHPVCLQSTTNIHRRTSSLVAICYNAHLYRRTSCLFAINNEHPPKNIMFGCNLLQRTSIPKNILSVCNQQRTKIAPPPPPPRYNVHHPPKNIIFGCNLLQRTSIPKNILSVCNQQRTTIAPPPPPPRNPPLLQCASSTEEHVCLQAKQCIIHAKHHPKTPI